LKNRNPVKKLLPVIPAKKPAPLKKGGNPVDIVGLEGLLGNFNWWVGFERKLNKLKRY